MSKKFKHLSPISLDWECTFLYKSVTYIPGTWSVKIECGHWKVLEKSLKILVFFFMNPVY